jgi:hypothetical protein
MVSVYTTFAVEQLFGPKLAVLRVVEMELKQLSQSEATQVFEVVRGRIMGEGMFGTEPPGVAGLTVLVKAQPILQTNLIDFLEGLPYDRCGPWVVSGWEGVIKDSEVSNRFNKLLETWSTLTMNPMLKSAAAATLKTRKSWRGGENG